MLLLINNYDSFTYNLLHYLGELGAKVLVKRNDMISSADALSSGAAGIVISPGLCDPDRTGICLELIETAKDKLPIFGVCLGFQAIGQAFSACVIRAPKPMHGKTNTISHNGTGLFDQLPNPFSATRYHSLMLERDDWPAELEITAESEDGLIMGLRHRTLPISGVQFHPESIASEHGHHLLKTSL